MAEPAFFQAFLILSHRCKDPVWLVHELVVTRITCLVCSGSLGKAGGAARVVMAKAGKINHKFQALIAL
jgi:hypothetical protein